MASVLLVEDEEVLRDVYETVLRSHGDEVTVARDGAEALEICAKAKFDIVLLDLMMPNLDGVGFLQEAKMAEAAPATKIIVFSNISSRGNTDEAMALGAHKLVLKSDLTPNDLLALVNEHGPRGKP